MSSCNFCLLCYQTYFHTYPRSLSFSSTSSLLLSQVCCGYPFMVLLEDDVILSSQFINLIRSHVSFLREGRQHVVPGMIGELCGGKRDGLRGYLARNLLSLSPPSPSPSPPLSLSPRRLLSQSPNENPFLRMKMRNAPPEPKETRSIFPFFSHTRPSTSLSGKFDDGGCFFRRYLRLVHY